MQSYTFSKEELYRDDEYDYIFNVLRKLVEKERKEVSPEYKNISDYKFIIGENVARVLHISKPDRIFDFEVIYESSYVFEPNSVDFLIVDKFVEYCCNDVVATEKAFNRLTDASTINEPNRIKYNKMFKKENKKMDIKLYECGTFIGGVVTKPQDLIKNVIFSGPCTIVQWSDGDKTIVRCENEDFDKEKGLAMAIVKKLFGTNESKSNYNDIFKKWIPEEDKTNKKLEERNNTEILTAKQLAEKTGLSVSTVLRDCRRGLHPGAMKVDGKWLIPYSGLVKDNKNEID